MATLSVRDFSCIEQAELSLAQITIMIGPQASGKSVISKLVYFFNDILSNITISIEDNVSFDDFSDQISDTFVKWFPPSAWGAKRFQISYSAGPFSVQVERRRTRKKNIDRVAITFSDYLRQSYDEFSETIRSIRNDRDAGRSDLSRHRFDTMWRVRREAIRKFSEDLGVDYADYQMFVPAGRSFFTSIGKAVAVFEQGGILDPITVRFGRMFATYRDMGRDMYYREAREDETTRTLLMKQLFGGSIRFDRETEYVETDDGRRVPFAYLSSGQQELLPLWMTLTTGISFADEPSLIYIEEPEAHLFPTAQSLLIEYLAALTNSRETQRRMVITTHSPYVLAKINNLLKAGNTAKGNTRINQARIGAVIPRESWLTRDSVQAYAIIGRVLTPILDEDGLIDAEYLDEVSSDISKEFSNLLEIECSE